MTRKSRTETAISLLACHIERDLHLLSNSLLLMSKSRNLLSPAHRIYQLVLMTLVHSNDHYFCQGCISHYALEAMVLEYEQSNGIGGMSPVLHFRDLSYDHAQKMASLGKSPCQSSKVMLGRRIVTR